MRMVFKRAVKMFEELTPEEYLTAEVSAQVETRIQWMAEFGDLLILKFGDSPIANYEIIEMSDCEDHFEYVVAERKEFDGEVRKICNLEPLKPDETYCCRA